MSTGIIPSTWSGPILSVLRVITGLLFLAQWRFIAKSFP